MNRMLLLIAGLLYLQLNDMAKKCLYFEYLNTMDYLIFKYSGYCMDQIEH